jgi:hypothetical protein
MTGPLFIPLTGHWFDVFASGAKTVEYRPYGARWNERTCALGRSVTLSRGYGKMSRLSGTVAGFRVVDADADPAIRSVYPEGERFAAITIHLSIEGARR